MRKSPPKNNAGVRASGPASGIPSEAEGSRRRVFEDGPPPRRRLFFARNRKQFHHGGTETRSKAESGRLSLLHLHEPGELRRHSLSIYSVLFLRASVSPKWA